MSSRNRLTRRDRGTTVSLCSLAELRRLFDAVALPPVFMPGSDTGTVSTRRLNRQRLLGAIRRFGPVPRADLAKRTPLSSPTISALVEELVGTAGVVRRPLRRQ